MGKEIKLTISNGILVHPEEKELLNKILELHPEEFSELNIKKRRSSKIYDIETNGREVEVDIDFTAWLPLQVIHLANWPDYSHLSDYPYMDGDWSGIRDSSEETIWNIFEEVIEDQFVL